jgi:hypothetical protein
MSSGVVRIVAHMLKHQQTHGLISDWEKSAKFSDCNTQQSIEHWICSTFGGAEICDGHSTASKRTGAGWSIDVNNRPDIVLPDAVASAAMKFINDKVSYRICSVMCRVPSVVLAPALKLLGE